MNFEEALQTLIASKEIDSVSFDRVPVNNIITTLKDKFDVDKYEYDANGYSVDFWIHFTYGGSSFSVSGDLWYKDAFEVYIE